MSSGLRLPATKKCRLDNLRVATGRDKEDPDPKADKKHPVGDPSPPALISASNSFATSLSTPVNQNRKNWSDYGLIPSKLTKAVEEAEEQAMKDGFDQEEMNETEYQLVMFLYGTGFFDTFSDGQRKLEVDKFCANEDIIERLVRVVFSPTEDSISVDVGLESYVNFAVTCEYLRDYESLTPGVPTTPYLRLQTSGVCYIVAVAMFLTLHLQKYGGEARQKPIDVGWLARHYVTHDLEGLKSRVIDDSGGCSRALLHDILGSELFVCNVKYVGLKCAADMRALSKGIFYIT